MGRTVSAQSVIYDQLDFYQINTQIRQSGISIINLSAKLFVNNQVLPWNLVDGTPIPDSSISASNIYFNEISGNPGFYSIRFFPDRIGFWRIIVSTPTLEIIKEYDIASSSVATGSLNASFSC